MAEHELAVAVEEVGDAERPHLRGEALDDGEPGFERRRRDTLPDLGQAIEQEAEALLGIGLADGMEAVHRTGEQGLDLVEAAVVGEEMHAACELAYEGLRVGEPVAADDGAAEVGDQEMRRMQMPLDEAEQRTVAGRLGLLVEGASRPSWKATPQPSMLRVCDAPWAAKWRSEKVVRVG